jgi:hypothetical protein
MATKAWRAKMEARAQYHRKLVLRCWGVKDESRLSPEVREALAASMAAWRDKRSPADELRLALEEHDAEWQARRLAYLADHA